jgi:hypothetical protein
VGIRLRAFQSAPDASMFGGNIRAGEVEDYIWYASSLLPVEMTYFNAEAVENDAVLTWETASEINNDYFSVQRSTNALDWNEIGLVDGYGNSTEVHEYAYIDGNLSTGRYYYRLQQHDFDGSYEYSDVKYVEIYGGRNTVVSPISYYPVPTHVNGTLTIEGLTKDDRMEVYLYALNGSMAVKTSLSGTMIFDLSPYNLEAGMYIMDIYQADVIYSLKLILYE